MTDVSAERPPSPFESYFEDPYLSHEWLILCRSSDLPDGKVKSAMAMGEPLVLWRAHGKVHAWRDLCIHRGSKLSRGKVVDDCLVCPYHSWTYNGEGRCVRIPAHPDITIPEKARTTAYKAIDHAGHIWVCLGTPQRDPPPAIWYGEVGFNAIPAGPYKFDAVGPRAIENFLDVAHLGIVHDGLLGASDRPTIEQYEVKKTEDGLFAPAVKLYQPDFQSVGSGQYVYYDYHIFRPLTVQLKSNNMGKPGPGFSVWLSVCPVNRNHCVGWMWLIHNIEGVPDEVFVEREDLILSQDIGIVNTQHPELLPLDLREELHLMSDRTAIEYRKWIRELGLRYGTA